MDDLWIFLVFTAWPLYVANASAVVSGGKTPIDFNHKWSDGKPIFGKGKTWRGTFVGIGSGTLAGFAAMALFPALAASVSIDYLTYTLLLSAGAILGDMAGSFLKRRIGFASGQPAQLLDQLDFVIGGVLLGTLITPFHFTETLLLVMVTPFMHIAFNRLAYILKIKSVPW